MLQVNTSCSKTPSDCGWVNDPEPESEFQETINKSKAMLKAVALAETFNR